MYSINVKSKDNTLTVNVSNVDVYKHYQKLQQYHPLTPSSSKRLGFVPTGDFDTDIVTLYNNYWNILLESKIYDDLPTCPKILDIGSGIGMIDFLAYQYLGNTGKFYLLDGNVRTRFSDQNIYSTNATGHGFYNSWLVSKDIISASNFSADDFIFIDPEDIIWLHDDKFDLITSYGSWGWHYSFDTYWDKVKTYLKVGGKLLINVSKQAKAESDVLNTISKEFNSDPIFRHEFISSTNNNDAINQGYRYCWIRK
jgi:SAM-dependent methyltransferase